MASQRITEIKTIDVYQQCVDNPVYLRWFSADGGENYWLFHTVQERGLNISTLGIINHSVDDLATTTRERDVYGKVVDPQMTIGSDEIDETKLAGIESLLYSTRVEMLVLPWSPPDVPVWRTIVVLPGSFKTQQTDRVFQSIELTISLPEINTQRQ